MYHILITGVKGGRGERRTVRVDNEMIDDIFITIIELIAVRAPHAEGGKRGLGDKSTGDRQRTGVEANIVRQRMGHDPQKNKGEKVLHATHTSRRCRGLGRQRASGALRQERSTRFQPLKKFLHVSTNSMVQTTTLTKREMIVS